MAQGRRAGAKIPSYKKEKEWGRKKDGEGEGRGERERVRWGRGLAGAQKRTASVQGRPGGHKTKWQSNR